MGYNVLRLCVYLDGNVRTVLLRHTRSNTSHLQLLVGCQSCRFQQAIHDFGENEMLLVTKYTSFVASNSVKASMACSLHDWLFVTASFEQTCGCSCAQRMVHFITLDPSTSTHVLHHAIQSMLSDLVWLNTSMFALILALVEGRRSLLDSWMDTFVCISWIYELDIIEGCWGCYTGRLFWG